MSMGIGTYPGGPHGLDSPTERRRRPRLMRLEEISELADRRVVQHKRRRRRLRMAVGAAVAMLGGLGVGWAVGHRAHRTVQEVIESQRETSVEGEISKEVNRTLLELWKMEDVQYDRNRRPR
jgi:hypothetical protein